MDVDVCPKSGILLNGVCDGTGCWDCGWNPEVNAKRRKQIRRYARCRLLHLWGKDNSPDAESKKAGKALERTRQELDSFTTV